MSPAEVGERLKRAGIPYEWRDFPVSAAAVAGKAIAIPTGRLLGRFVIESHRRLAGNRSLARLAETCCDLRQIAPSVRLGSAREVFVLAMPDYPVIGGRIDMGLYLRGDGDCLWLPENLSEDALDSVFEVLIASPTSPHVYPDSLLKQQRPFPKRTSETRDRGASFQLIDDKSILQRCSSEPLIKGVLPAASLACLYGKPGAMKTFVALDMALSLVTGEPWAGQYAVTQGPVVYVVGEGITGFRLRVAAWKESRGLVEEQGLLLIDQAVQLADPQQLSKFLRCLGEMPEPPVLVIIDTLARCFEGNDENSAKDMGGLVGAVDQIRREVGASVLLVHHSGRTDDHERGSTALRGAADTLISAKLSAEGLQLNCQKQKDFEPFGAVSFRPQRVDVLDGSSLILVPSYRAVEATSLSRSESTALAALSQPAWVTEGLTHGDWFEKSGMVRSTFGRARNELVEKGLVVQIGDRYYTPDIAQIIRSQSLTPVSPRSHETNPGDVSVVSPPFRGETVGPGTAPVQNWDDIPSL